MPGDFRRALLAAYGRYYGMPNIVSFPGTKLVTALPGAAPLPHHVTVVATVSMIHSTDLGIFRLVMPHHVTVVATASMIHSTDLGILNSHFPFLLCSLSLVLYFQVCTYSCS